MESIVLPVKGTLEVVSLLNQAETGREACILESAARSSSRAHGKYNGASSFQCHGPLERQHLILGSNGGMEKNLPVRHYTNDNPKIVLCAAKLP